MTSLFISYSRKDIEAARKLTQALKDQELDFWIDWEGIPPTVDWWREIEKGIEEANIFIFLISPDSARSKVCKREIEHAAKNGKRLIPLIVRDIKAEESPTELAHLNWLFFRQSDDFASAFHKLKTAIQTDYEWAEIHRRLQMRALEWERGSRDKSFLLRGRDLDDAQAQLVMNAGKNPNPTELQSDYVLTSRQVSDRQRRTITGSAVAGLIIMAALAVYGFVQASLARTAEAQADERAVLARAGELAAQSISQRTRDFTVSLLLGVEAYRSRDTVQTRGALLDNVYANPVLQAYLRKHTSQVSSLAFSPDGRFLASTGPSDGKVLLWGIKDNNFAIQTLTMDGDSVAFSPDGDSLAVGGGEQIAVWDLGSGVPKQRFTTQSELAAANVLFSPDGKIVISANTDRAVNIWDATTGQLLGQPLAEQPPNSSNPNLAFSLDGKTLALSGEESISLWNIDTRERAEVPFNLGWRGVTNTGGSLAFHPDGETLAAGTSNRITLWNVETQVALGDTIEVPTTDIRSYESQVSTLAFSSDGNILASGSEDGTIVLWDVSAAPAATEKSTYEAIYTLTGQVSGVFSPVTSFAFSADGKTLASGHDDGTIILWNLELMLNKDQEVPEQIGRSLLEYDTIANSVAFSADGKKLALGFGDGTLQIWDLIQGQPLNISESRQDGGVLNLTFSPDPEGKMIASAAQDVYLVDGETGQRMGQPLDGQQDRVTSISFHPEGKILASVGFGTVILWDLETRKALDPLPITREIQSVAFRPDGKTLAAGSADGYVLLWDLETSELIAELDANGDAIFSIAFSPDGKMLAAGNADSTIFLWDVDSRQQTGPPLNRHTGIVNQVAFSPDGQMLASGSMDGTIILWDVPTRQAVGQPLDVNSSGVNSVAFNPDGKMLASGSGNFDQGRIILWDVSVLSWLQKTCQRASRNFTVSEWDQFFPDEPYRKTCDEFQRDPEYYRALARDLLSAQPLELQQAMEDLKAEMETDTVIEQPAQKAYQLIAVIVNDRITDEAYNGSALKALDLMDQARENNLTLDSWLMDANFFNRLCWDGSLLGSAGRVLQYCDQAVALAPDDPDVRDSRGLARALMNDTSGAIEDFNFFIRHSDEASLIEQRRAWVSELESGNNPFTPELLEQLKD